MDGKEEKKKLKYPVMMKWSKKLKMQYQSNIGNIFVHIFVFDISGGGIWDHL